MGIINVQTDDGIKRVQIEGDKPTDEEQEFILNTFFSEQLPEFDASKPSVATGTSLPQINLATASVEEIEDYKRNLELAGVNPTTMQPFQEGETSSLKLPGVDYDTGVQDFSFRTAFGNLELPSEKEEFLKRRVGTTGFTKDPGGRFILTQEGRDKLNLGIGKPLAIDEEGASRYDVADFLGASGIPLSVGIGAGIAMSGSAFLPAAAVVGTSMFLGKLIDEAFETSRGLQKQTSDEILRDAALEGAFGVFGEGLGRGLSRIFGRLIKGSGSAEAEIVRAEGRQFIQQGFQPTLEGAAPNLRPILGRLQAIYEGVFPNTRAASTNLKRVIEELGKIRTIDDASLETLETTIKKDISKIYDDVDAKVVAQQRALDTEIENSIKAIIEPLRRGEKVSQNALDDLLMSKKNFDEQSDLLFSEASKNFGTNSRVIPIQGIKEAYDYLVNQLPRREALTDTQLNELLNKGIDGAIARGGKIPDVDPTTGRVIGQKNLYDRKSVLPFAKISVEEAQLIRKIINNLQYDDKLATASSGGVLKNLKSSVEKAFDEAEDTLAFITSSINPEQAVGQQALRSLSDAQNQRIGSLLRQGGFEFGKTFREGSTLGADTLAITVDDLRQITKGLTDLRRAREFYSKGINRYDDVIVEKIYAESKNASLKLDPTNYLDLIVKNNKPNALRRFLFAVKGTPQFKNFDAGKQFLSKQKIQFAGRTFSIEEAERLLPQFAPGKQKTNLINRINNAKQKAESLTTRVGAEQSDAMRQSLARAWFERELSNPMNKTKLKGVDVLSGTKIADQIDALGSTADELFKGYSGQVKNLAKLLRQTGTEGFDEQVLAQFATSDMPSLIRGLQQAVKTQAEFKGDAFLNSLRASDAEGIVDQLFKRQNSLKVKQFVNGSLKVNNIPIRDFGSRTMPDGTITQVFNPQLVDKVRTAALSKILRSIGDIDSPAFKDAFLSGRLGKRFETALNSYGVDTLDAMLGKETTEGLYKLANNMIRVSNQPLAGRGGLSAPNIAIGLGIGAMLLNPLATLPVAAFYLTMSSMLRNPTVLKVLLASRQPGADKLGQAFQIVNTAVAQTGQEVVRSDEGLLKIPPEISQPVQKAITDISKIQIPNIKPPANVGSAGGVNPILVPNPVTRATVGSQ